MKYAYIEITERCNFQCPFCPSAKITDPRVEMSEELFTNVLQNLQGNVQEIFFHVLGEPLLHPKFARFLQIAQDFRFPVNLTTNGSLIVQNEQTLLQNSPIRQINFSTHAYAYLSENYREKILQQTILFADKLTHIHPEIYVNFRLWNDQADAESNEWNHMVLQKLQSYFGTNLNLSDFSVRHKSTPITGRIYLHRDSRFEWPDGKAEDSKKGTCHGILDQCAILSDGRVVPCCLDYKGHIVLGKIPENSFDDIFQSPKASQMKNGFIQHKLTEPFCRRCAFAKRFSK